MGANVTVVPSELRGRSEMHAGRGHRSGPGLVGLGERCSGAHARGPIRWWGVGALGFVLMGFGVGGCQDSRPKAVAIAQDMEMKVGGGDGKPSGEVQLAPVTLAAQDSASAQAPHVPAGSAMAGVEPESLDKQKQAPPAGGPDAQGVAPSQAGAAAPGAAVSASPSQWNQASPGTSVPEGWAPNGSSPNAPGGNPGGAGDPRAKPNPYAHDLSGRPPDRPRVPRDILDPPLYTQEALKSLKTVTLSGTIHCKACTGKILLNVVAEEKFITMTTVPVGAFSMLVPEGVGVINLTGIEDVNGDGKPSQGETLGAISGGPLQVQNSPLSGLSITIL